MEHYVGLDVSLKLTAICIIDRTGKIEREGVVPSDPEAIARYHPHCMPRIDEMTGNPSLFSSVHSHVAVAPVSSPMRA